MRPIVCLPPVKLPSLGCLCSFFLWPSADQLTSVNLDIFKVLNVSPDNIQVKIDQIVRLDGAPALQWVAPVKQFVNNSLKVNSQRLSFQHILLLKFRYMRTSCHE